MQPSVSNLCKKSSAEAQRLLRPFFLLKGRNSLRSDSLPFLTQKARAALHASSLRRSCAMGMQMMSLSSRACRDILRSAKLNVRSLDCARDDIAPTRRMVLRLSGGWLPAVKKGRLSERSEFLPFRTEGVRSSPGSADGVLSFWYLFLSDKRKKKYMKRKL